MKVNVLKVAEKSVLFSPFNIVASGNMIQLNDNMWIFDRSSVASDMKHAFLFALSFVYGWDYCNEEFVTPYVLLSHDGSLCCGIFDLEKKSTLNEILISGSKSAPTTNYTYTKNQIMEMISLLNLTK